MKGSQWYTKAVLLVGCMSMLPLLIGQIWKALVPHGDDPKKHRPV